jgi:predicted GNAT family acetyltransferase
MQVVKYSSAKEFLEANGSALVKNEAANSIILGYATNQTNGVETAMSTDFFAVVEDDIPILPAMFTPEAVPLLADGPEDASRILARYFYPSSPQPTGVTGPKDVALAFADEWERLTNCDLELHHNTRLYDCKTVARLDLPAGSVRQATQDDFELVKKWRYEFKRDANTPLGTSDEQITLHIKQGRYYFWVTDLPVSMALLARETVNGATIGAVYTPGEYRNHGYATAVTSAVTQIILDSGKKYATLYADLDNPTSNSIYQKMGYSPVMDATVWNFIPSI